MNGESGCGHVKSNTLSVVRSLRKNMFLSSHTATSTHPRAICEQCGANLCCPHYQPEIKFTVCPVPKKTRILSGPGRARLRRKSFDFLARPTTTNHKGVPESKVCELDEASLRRQHWRREPRECTKCVVVEVKSFLRHIIQRRRPVEFW